MDNRQFNVNGTTKEMLARTLSLAMEQEKATEVTGFVFTPQKGLILLQYVTTPNYPVKTFPVAIKQIDTLTSIVWEWLQSPEATQCLDHLDDNRWDVDLDHDGHNIRGWRVYCEDWGHVSNFSSAIVAIKPVYAWLGK